MCSIICGKHGIVWTKSWMYEVVINGAAKEIGKAAAVAVTKARGMEVAGAVDSVLVGQDAGKIIDELISSNQNEFKGEPEALVGEWQLLWSSQAGCRHLDFELGSHDVFGSFPLKSSWKDMALTPLCSFLCS